VGFVLRELTKRVRRAWYESSDAEGANRCSAQTCCTALMKSVEPPIRVVRAKFSSRGMAAARCAPSAMSTEEGGHMVFVPPAVSGGGCHQINGLAPS